METEAKVPIIKRLLDEMQREVKESRTPVKAAQAYAGSGNVTKAVQVSMDLDQTLYDLGRLHDAVTLIGKSSIATAISIPFMNGPS